MGRWGLMWRAWGRTKPPGLRSAALHCRHASSFPLPRQPLPSLAETTARYLRSLEPLVSPEELEQTQKLLAEFGVPGGDGERLQARLQRRADRMENWITDWWVQSAYLESRLPLAVHSSPAVVLPKQDFNDWKGQLRFAAKLIAGVLDFKAKIDHQTLLVEYSRGYPLCMEQYSRIFASCRLPGPKHDSVLLPPPGRRPPTYITVVRNFQFFQLEVYNSDGTPLTVDQLHWQLQRIRAQSWKTDKEPLGVLTSDHRHTWGQAYTTLMRDKLNRESARAIQRSLFTVCLDAPVLKVSDALASSRLAAQMLHGGGSYSNSGNRWFDKTLQFIVGEDGSCGVLYEQAVAEGPPIATIIDHVLDYCKDPVPVRAPLIPLQLPKKLYFCFTPEIKRDIEHAKQNLDILITDLDISCFTYCRFGKELLKRLRLSPDSVLQVALQLAYYRAHGELCATAESASLRRFHRGRTETIRSTTSAALAFVRAMADDDCQAPERLSLLKKAVEVHSTLTEQALAGQGIDRHLLGMKLEAIADGFRVPELFMDTSYAVASHWKLSTGQVAARTDCVMCYGPLVPNGYAVCYNPLPTHVNFAVTAFNCCQETNAEHLAGSIRKALDDMGALLGNWGVGSQQRQP
ncbi:carnitine O-acetyltransferase-like isoform X1 [Lacerta agilis]|uniref:carnitine O-acetyltransferase-like isoform X1 n=1 Tax=Lacerta agilis TaxID=80427 RepID=UPI001419F9E1|nr:carnitine O-acetyltransferase-like isoform X1 [Lacerta agilis]